MPHTAASDTGSCSQVNQAMVGEDEENIRRLALRLHALWEMMGTWSDLAGVDMLHVT